MSSEITDRTASYTGRRTHVQRLVLTAVMTALSIAGRFIFAAVPGFKPVTAIVVITGIYMGGAPGFATGALSALISNFYFGQGPWTPFQMLTWGLIGLIAGLLRRPLKKNIGLLCIYGFAAGFLYSLVLDCFSVLWMNKTFNGEMYAAAVVSSLPFTLLYAVSNVIFLLVLRIPLGKKLDRISIKYGYKKEL